MQTSLSNSNRLDIVGSNNKSDQEIFHSTLKRWREKLGFCSMVAAVPALLVSNLPAIPSASAENVKTTIPGRSARLSQKWNLTSSKRALLKRQSEFRLPHQNSSFAAVATAGGVDECPGAVIPGGNYTVAAPYIASGDTTGANNTVNSLASYYYYFYGNYGASGPDHVYSFTITGLGPNPQIEVSTTSGTYKPLAYVLTGQFESCPAGTGNLTGNWLGLNDSRWNSGSTVTLGLEYFPLNVPLYLFVDSQLNDAAGAGAYTIKMKDVTIAPAPPCSSANPIDCHESFVRQQYLDFLNREPEAAGLDFYLNILNGCGADVECVKYTRGALSANFFRSPEFQRKGNYVMYLYMVSIGQRPVTSGEIPTKNDPALHDRPHYAEFAADLASISTPNDDPALTEQKKNELANNWLTRPQLVSIYGGLSNARFVQKLIDVSGVTPANQNWVAELNAGTKTRAQVLRQFAESPEVNAKFYQQSFVTMEYFGYLRRDPEDCHNPANWTGGDPNQCGYIFHNNRFNTPGANPDLIENLIVRGFIESPEYRSRF